MVDLEKDLEEARDILEGRTLKQPTLAHLKAMQCHHEDTLIQISMKLAQTHDWVMELP